MNRRNIPPALPGNPYGQSQAAGMGPAPPLPPGPAPAQPAYAPQADQGAAHAAAWAAYYQSQGIAAPSAYAASPQPAQPAAPIQASGSNPYANYGYGAGARHGHGPAQPGYPAQPAAPIGPTSQSYRPPGAGTQPYAATPAQPAATVAYPQPYSQAAGGAYPGQQGYSSQQYPSQQGYAGQQQQQPQQQQQAYPGWPAQQSQGYNAGQGSPYQSTTAQQPFYPQSQQPQSYTPQAPVSNSPYRPSTPAPMHSQNRPYQPQPGNRLPSGPGRPPISAPTGPQGGFPPSKRPRFDGPGGMGMGMNGNAGMAQPIRPPVRPAVRPGPNMNMGQPGFNGVVRPPNINRGVGIVPPVVRPPIRLGLGGPPPNLGPRGAMPMRGRSGGPVNAPRGPAIMRRNERGASIPQRPETKSDREKEKKHREKEKELKTTMTDFRIVGIEMKALDWKWGLVDGQDDTVEDTEEKNELDDLKQTDQAELPKQAEDVKVDVAGPEDAIEAADTIQMVNEVAADESTSKTSEETEGVKVEHATETNGEAVPAVIETNGEADSVEENPAQAADQEASDGAGVEEKRGEKRKAKTPDGDDDERSTKRPDYHLTHNKPTQGNHESNSNRFRIYFESPPELDRIPKAARRNPNKRWKRESSSVAPSRPEDVEAGDGVPAVQETLDAEGVENGSSDVENKAEPAAPTSETATVEQTVPDELITTGAEPGADPLPVTQAAPPLETPVDVTVTVTTSEVPQESNVAPVDEALSVPSIPIEVTAVDAEDGVPLALEEAVSLPQADQPDSNVNQVDEAIELGDISMRTDSGLIAEVLASSGGGTANEGAAESVGPATDEAEAGPVAPAENGVGHTEPSETLVPSEIGTEVSAGEVESTITKSAENAASAYRSRTRRRSSLSSNDSRDDDAEQPLDGPSFNRLSILYEDSKRRLCFDAAVVQRVKIYRADAKIEVILLPIKSQEVKEETPAGEGVPEDVKVDTETKTALPKGVLVEMYDDTDQRFVSVDQEKLKQLWTETTDHTESVPPVHKAFTPAAASASSLTIVVHLNKKRPLSEPKWCRTNLADEWLVEQFGGKVASSSSGWSGKLEIVDPDPPPTLRTILETWASSSPVGVASDRRAFTTSLLADPNDLLEILLRLTRGERNPTAPTALATAIRTDSPYASHQTHVSLAILAMYRLTTDYAAKAGETVDVLNDKIGDIIKSLPVSMIHKSLDGMFREWERRV